MRKEKKMKEHGREKVYSARGVEKMEWEMVQNVEMVLKEVLAL